MVLRPSEVDLARIWTQLLVIKSDSIVRTKLKELSSFADVADPKDSTYTAVASTTTSVPLGGATITMLHVYPASSIKIKINNGSVPITVSKHWVLEGTSITQLDLVEDLGFDVKVRLVMG